MRDLRMNAPSRVLRDLARDAMGALGRRVGSPPVDFPFSPPAPRAPAAPPAPSSPRSPQAPAPPVAPAAPGRGVSAQWRKPQHEATERDQREDARRSDRPVAEQHDGEKRSGLGTRALEVAQGEVGVREDPVGSNRGPRVDEYTGKRAQAWCAHFVSWCFEKTGESPFGHVALVADLRSWAERRGKLHTPGNSFTPRPGDVFTMPRNDDSGKQVGGHTGFVEEVSSSGKVATIEGNVGDGVKRLSRPISSLDGFIRL